LDTIFGAVTDTSKIILAPTISVFFMFTSL
jgi:hypothetical protein